MKYDAVQEAIAEAKRFIKRAEAYQKTRTFTKWSSRQGGFWSNGAPIESGACRRASMDLTRALAKMRRPR